MESEGVIALIARERLLKEDVSGTGLRVIRIVAMDGFV